MADIIYGRHPVLEALQAGEELAEIQIASGVVRGRSIQQILHLAAQAHVPVKRVPRVAIDRTVAGAGGGGGSHQGVLAVVSLFRYSDVAEILAEAVRRREPPFVLVLDQVQDVHNLGHLIRTAVAVGVHGVLLPERRAAGVSPAVRKASAGTVAHVAVARVELVMALDKLREHGVTLVGLEASAETLYTECVLSGPLGLVVGSEGQGLRRAVARRCDVLVRLPMPGPTESLNAGVAGSVVLYEALRQRRGS